MNVLEIQNIIEISFSTTP